MRVAIAVCAVGCWGALGTMLTSCGNTGPVFNQIDGGEGSEVGPDGAVDSGSSGDSGSLDGGPASDASSSPDAHPPGDAAPDGPDAGGPRYWVRVPATVDFVVDYERCRAVEGATVAVEVMLHWSESCQRPGPVQVDMDEASRTVTLSGWLWEQKGVACDPVEDAVQRTVELPPLSAGTWTINGEAVEVESSSSSCAADPAPDGSTCTLDCDCEAGLDCVPVLGDAVCRAECAELCNSEGMADCHSCENDGDIGSRCVPPTDNECDPEAVPDECPRGQECAVDPDSGFARCEWSVSLGSATRGECTSDDDCLEGLDCVEHGPGDRRCEVRCRTRTMPCPGPAPHTCNRDASVEDTPWVCAWIGE